MKRSVAIGSWVSKVMRQIAAMMAGAMTTLMVTHDPRILELADRIVTMEDGKIR